VITRRDLTPIPITPIIIETVEGLAQQDNSKGFRFRTQNGQVLYDTSWIAGVDYTESIVKKPRSKGKKKQKKRTNIDKDSTKSNQSCKKPQDSKITEISDHEAYFEAENGKSNTTGQLKSERSNQKRRIQSEKAENEVKDSSDELNSEFTHDSELNSEINEEDDLYEDYQGIEAEENEDSSHFEEKQEDEDMEELLFQDSTHHNFPGKQHQKSNPPPIDRENDEEKDEKEEKIIDQTLFRRSTRKKKQPDRIQPTMTGKTYAQAVTQSLEAEEYNDTKAFVMAKTIQRFNEIQNTSIATGKSFLETFSLQKGLKKFGEKGKQAAIKEMKQLHDRVCFEPIRLEELSPLERKRSLESLIFLVEKKSGEVKAQTCANGSIQRNWMTKEESMSPTVSTPALFMTAAIEAHEGRDVATCDIPNAFIQTEQAETDKDGQRYTMKIRGKLAHLLVEIDPETYKPYLTKENGHDIIYVRVLKAIYGMLQSALLFYKKLRMDLETSGFKVNDYDPCVANKMVRGTQMTVVWHVDDMKISHKLEGAVTSFLNWIEDRYGTIGKVKITRGKVHKYLGMTLDYSQPGKVIINMKDYVKKDMLNEFPSHELKETASSPANENLFKINESSPKLSQTQKESFHTMVAKGLFLGKRARQEIQTTISFLCTRVQSPTQQDWAKL